MLGQQPLKGLAVIICKCGSNSVIAAFHNSHQCSNVNKQGAVRCMMGDGSNLATRVYHQDTKYPGAAKLSPLPAHCSLTAGWIDCALFFFFHWQNIPFCRALVLPLIPLLHENYMRELCWCCSREMWSLPVCREGSAETKGVCTENYIGQALVWWLYFEGHLQGFPHGPFKEGFLLQWRAKTFYQLSARSIMSCSMAPHPI